MATVYLRRTNLGLLPASEVDADLLKSLKLDEVIEVTTKKMRNYKHHCKFLALCRFVSENSDIYDTVEKAKTGIKIAMGWCDFFPDPASGELVPMPRGINFEAMDQVEFSAWYEQAVSACCRHITPHMTRMDFNRAVEEVASW